MGQLEISLEGYTEIKNSIREKLNETVGGFVVIGYRLKQVRDSGAYKYDGYTGIEEFAEKEYGLGASTANRFMNINTEFSQGGNSMELLPEYRGWGYSKLQEMLNVSPEDRGLVTEETTVRQIRELKKAEEAQRAEEMQEEQRSLPLIKLAAPDVPSGIEITTERRDPFGSVMEAFWKENRVLYARVKAGLVTPEILAEEISPSGSRTFRQGVNMMFFYDHDRGVKLRSYADGQAAIIQYTYREIMEKIPGSGMVPTKKEEGRPDGQAATSQCVETPHIPIPGQATVEDIPDIMPDTTGKSGDGEIHTGTAKNKTGAATDEGGFTDDEIICIIAYFDTEYSRMESLPDRSLKKMSYRAAGECLRKCYRKVAERMERDEEKYEK